MQELEDLLDDDEDMKDCYLARKEDHKAAAEEAARGSQGGSDEEIEQQESGDLFGLDPLPANHQIRSAFNSANAQMPSDGEKTCGFGSGLICSRP